MLDRGLARRLRKRDGKMFACQWCRKPVVKPDSWCGPECEERFHANKRGTVAVSERPDLLARETVPRTELGGAARRAADALAHGADEW